MCCNVSTSQPPSKNRAVAPPARSELGKKFIFPKPLRSINRPKSVLNMFGVEGQILAPAGAEDFNQ